MLKTEITVFLTSLQMGFIPLFSFGRSTIAVLAEFRLVCSDRFLFFEVILVTADLFNPCTHVQVGLPSHEYIFFPVFVLTVMLVVSCHLISLVLLV